MDIEASSSQPWHSATRYGSTMAATEQKYQVWSMPRVQSGPWRLHRSQRGTPIAARQEKATPTKAAPCGERAEIPWFLLEANQPKKQQDNITRETLKTNRHFGLGSEWLKMLKCFHVGSRAIPRRSRRAAASPPQVHHSEAPMATCRVQSTDTPLDRPGTFTPWKKLAKPKLCPRAPAYQHRTTMMSNLGDVSFNIHTISIIRKKINTLSPSFWASVMFIHDLKHFILSPPGKQS